MGDWQPSRRARFWIRCQICKEPRDEPRELLPEERCVTLLTRVVVSFVPFATTHKQRNPIWCFWKLDCHIKNHLFFSHRRSMRNGQPKQQPTNDPVTALFGTAVPAMIPESASWWQEPLRLPRMMHVCMCALWSALVKQSKARRTRRTWPLYLMTSKWG